MDNLTELKGRLDQDYQRLEGISGFHMLTENQQRIIKQSLYVQSRAERRTDPASARAIHNTSLGNLINGDNDLWWPGDSQLSTDKPDLRKYALSQNHISTYYCHSALFNLEMERSLLAIIQAVPANFFEADYDRYKSALELKQVLSAKQKPQVVIVSRKPNTSAWNTNIMHSFLYLGVDQNHEPMVWDKANINLPYRLTKLDRIFESYPVKEFDWGVRDVRSKNARA